VRDHGGVELPAEVVAPDGLEVAVGGDAHVEGELVVLAHVEEAVVMVHQPASATPIPGDASKRRRRATPEWPWSSPMALGLGKTAFPMARSCLSRAVSVKRHAYDSARPPRRRTACSMPSPSKRWCPARGA
jgi:hypothetical protein